MEIKVCVHLDPAEKTLVAGAARQEHCGLDAATLKALGGQLGRQVLMRRGAERLAPSPSRRRTASRAPPCAPEP